MLQFLSSILPAIILVYIFVSLDLFPEPKKNILITFILGILIIIPVVISGLILGYYYDKYFIDTNYYHILDISIAPITEETCKLLVIVMYCAKLKDFDEPMDGLVYGATASLGFAMFENIFYVFDNDLSPWETTAVARAILSVPSHSFDGVILGFSMSYYIFFNKKIIFPLLGLLTTMTLHFSWNFFAWSDQILFLIIVIQIIIVTFLFKDLRNRQKKHLKLRDNLYD